jgi:hypothetical protein
MRGQAEYSAMAMRCDAKPCKLTKLTIKQLARKKKKKKKISKGWKGGKPSLPLALSPFLCARPLNHGTLLLLLL